MKSSIEVLDAARAALGGVSQYRLAKVCGVSAQYVNNVMKGRDAIGSPFAIKLANIIGCEVAEIQAISAMERATDDQVRASWARLLERASVAVLACAFFTSSFAPGAQASALNGKGVQARAGGLSLRDGVYIMRSKEDEAGVPWCDSVGQ